MLRIVLDTNVWLDWLLFDDPAVAPIRKAVAEGTAEIMMDETTEGELARVLGYTFNNKTIAPEKRAALLEQCRRIALRAPNKMNSPPARGGVPAPAGGVVGANGAHVTTPGLPRLEAASGAVSHPPLLEKAGNKTRPVILLGALRDEIGGLRDEEKAILPKCEDPDDQKFLELALTSAAAYLVTRDGALLDLAEHKVRPLPFRIVTPLQLAAALKA